MSSIQFRDLKLGEQILSAVEAMGFEEPTKIQEASIPVILSGRDMAGQAQTGTGKTAAYAIPTLERVETSAKHVQVLVLCPTRELAVQVTGEFIKLSSGIEDLATTPVYGGQPIVQQIKQLRKGCQVVVGTPGRVIDHLKRGTLSLEGLSVVVLDEADEMLNMGFRDDLETILGFTNQKQNVQTIMFSATFSPGIKKIMNRWLQDPEMITVEGQAATADGVEQYIMEVRDSVRTEAICRVLDMNQNQLALVFCNTKRTCDKLVEEMQARGYSADVLHGDLNQSQRDKVMGRFRNGQIDVLVATDVAARGLDVDDVEIVFNYDIPHDPEYYVHRIGRTGRAGKKGVAYTFSSGRKSRSIRFIENQIGTRLKVVPMPTLSQVAQSHQELMMEEVIATLQAGGLRPWIDQLEEMLPEDFTPIEVAAALLKMKLEKTESAKVSAGKRPDALQSPEAFLEGGDSGRRSNGQGGRGDRKSGRGRGGWKPSAGKRGGKSYGSKKGEKGSSGSAGRKSSGDSPRSSAGATSGSSSRSGSGKDKKRKKPDEKKEPFYKEFEAKKRHRKGRKS